MKSSLKMIFVLTLIATLSGGLLSLWDAQTAPMVEKHRLAALVKAIAEVLPAHDYYEEIKGDGLTLFVAKKKESGKIVGVAFRAIGSGFQGKISVMIGVEPNFKELTGIKVLEQIETPGLGTKIVEDPSKKPDIYWFPKQFKGVKVQHEITVIKNAKPSTKTEIEAISGATITSKAVVQILNDKVRLARTIFKEKG